MLGTQTAVIWSSRSVNFRVSKGIYLCERVIAFRGMCVVSVTIPFYPTYFVYLNKFELLDVASNISYQSPPRVSLVSWTEFPCKEALSYRVEKSAMISYSMANPLRSMKMLEGDSFMVTFLLNPPTHAPRWIRELRLEYLHEHAHLLRSLNEITDVSQVFYCIAGIFLLDTVTT